MTVAPNHRYLECGGGAWSATITISVLVATWLMSTTNITSLRELTVAIPKGMYVFRSLASHREADENLGKEKKSKKALLYSTSKFIKQQVDVFKFCIQN